MSRKKSVSTKARKRKERYKIRVNKSKKNISSWNILILIIKARKKFLNFLNKSSVFVYPKQNIDEPRLFIENSNSNKVIYKKKPILISNNVNGKKNPHDFDVVKEIIKNMVTKVCRREYQRKRQLRIKESKTKCNKNIVAKISTSQKTRQGIWKKRKALENPLFHEKIKEQRSNSFRRKYMCNNTFNEKEKLRWRTYALNKYQSNDDFREKIINQSKINKLREYHNNNTYRIKYIQNMKKNILKKYHNNNTYRIKHIENMKKNALKKYHNNDTYRIKYIENMKKNALKKYHSNNTYRIKHIENMKKNVLKKYHNDNTYRIKHIDNIRKKGLKKYHNNNTYRVKYIENMKKNVLKKYHNDNRIRLMTITYAKNLYRKNDNPMIQNKRRLYNQSRRILKKYVIIESQSCLIKKRHLYLNSLKTFRKIIGQGPNYICIVCHLALFRNQVIPYIKQKYIKQNMSFEMKERIQSYINESLSNEDKWICKLCSNKLKQKQMPSRALVNKLQVQEIPVELKRLNDLEKHLIALRLPFMKIVNLTSSKLSSRLSQKGTKGPLHCVPSDVEDTVAVLPRPVDKSLMVRLQLKRRLKYKAIWEEQLINPNDVREALIILTKSHPGYKNIKIAEIDVNYLTSDKHENNEINNELLIESINTCSVTERDSAEEIQIFNEDHLKRLALGDVNNNVLDDDEEINEDHEDIRTKYNIGTDSCIQPCDFNDFLVFDKEPCIVAPAEKNKLSSLLTDKSIEALAFPHLFPNGEGSFDEERLIDLKWKEYCKARLFSADSRFAADSSYIFFLQYLGDLKQVYSGINVAFRKKLPINAKQSLDENQMRFLMNKDMIYRHLQTVRGSPEFWKHNLKNLFGMTRQINFPTLFLTFSCADLRWKEFTDTFAYHSQGKIKESYTFEEKTKLLRSNPVLAARLFERRFNSFMNLFIKGEACCLGKVMDWFVRIEMQMRGSPHAHMPLWIYDAPKYKGVLTDEKTREEIVKFCDKYITTRFPSLNEDCVLHTILKLVQTHSRNHSKSCLKCHNTLCRFCFPRPVCRRTFICEPIKIDNDNKKDFKKIKEVLREMNTEMNNLEKEKTLEWSDFDSILNNHNWTYDDYEFALRVVHTRPTIIHKREPNARWINQYNEELIRAWDANMDIQFILDPYACAKYLMSYTTKAEREMSLLLEATHKECREGNMTIREEMKKLTGTFFNHRQVSVQEAIYRATKMPLTYSSRGFVFVPAHSNSCKFLKPPSVLKEMDPDDENIYMSNLADKYFDRPLDPEFDICMADFASEYEIRSVNRNVKNPKTVIKQLQTLKFAVKKRCNRKAIIRYPYFNAETDKENYFENLLSLYLPIRNRDELKKPYEMFYQTGEVFDNREKCIRKVKDIVRENQKKYDAHLKETEEMESLYNQLSLDMKEDDWAEIVANKDRRNVQSTEIEEEDNPDFNIIHKKKTKNISVDLKQTYCTTDEMRPLLESMNEEQQQVFYYVRDWCINRLHNADVEPLRLFITGGAGTGKSHLLKCLHYEATKIFSRKKHLEADENIDEIHTLITAFTGAAAVNVAGVTIHSAFGIGTQYNSMSDNLSSEKLNTYRCKLGTLKLLFVDEVSLIQSNLWGAIHSRLTQIMGTHSNTTIFGNVGIIAIGDFYQCSPVASSSIYSSILWTDHFECVDLKINERQKTNVFFSQMLNRIRKIKKKEEMTKEDRDALEKCHKRYLNKEYHPEALHLFAKNAQVDEHNEKMLEQICTDIHTFYEVNQKDIELKPNENKQSKKTPKSLRLAKNARVMITKNISVNDGLANGVTGRIIDFIKENNSERISHIILKCDSPKVGRIHRVTCPHCHGHDTVCVTRENNTVDRSDFDLESKKGTKQFPLRLSWAMTIHKSQGITVDEVVVSTKDLFGSGIGYTALSRVRILKGLFLIDLYFDKFYCNEHVDKVISQMKEMKIRTPIFEGKPDCLNLLFHNIEGLQCHFNAFRNHYLTQKVDVICLAETWLKNHNQLNDLEINGYRSVHKIRSTSFELNHSLQGQKGGGVGIYIRQIIPFKSIDLPTPVNLELVSIEIETFNLIVIVCYRSPQHNKKEFLINLTTYLKQIDMNRKVLIIGDLNEDSLQHKCKPIQTQLQNMGLENIFKDLPTTNSFTSLDCIYSNFLQCEKDVGQIFGTFYSFHDMLFLSIQDNISDLNKYNQQYSYDDNIMEIDFSTDTTLNSNKIHTNVNKRKSLQEKGNQNKKSKQEILSNTMRDYINHNNNAYTSSNKKNTEQLNQYSNSREVNFLSNLKQTLTELSIPVNQVKYSTLNEQLSNINLRTIKIIGDGNCFFRAISDQLYNNQDSHRSLRSAAVEYISRNKDFYAAFVAGFYKDIDDYIYKMKQDEEYADHLCVMAMATVLNQNIIVHEYAKRPLIIPGSDYIDHQLHVAYFPNRIHYESVKNYDQTIPFISFENLQDT